MICRNYITLYTSFDRFDGPRKNCKTATSHLIDIRLISAEWKKSIWLCEIILASVVNGLTIKTVVDWNWNTALGNNCVRRSNKLYIAFTPSQ